MGLKPLLLAGGCSSRMGTRKELLRLPDGQPVYIHLLSILHQSCPESSVVFLSQADRKAANCLPGNDHRSTPRSDNLLALNAGGTALTACVIYDYDDTSEEKAEIGPAAGLLAAHRWDPTADWLVAACDYPLLTASAFVQLRQESTGLPVCFYNKSGFCEPLLGIWTPSALQVLEDNVRQGILGPKSAMLKSKGRMIRPNQNRWLINTNTPDDWKRAMELMENDNASDE